MGETLQTMRRIVYEYSNLMSVLSPKLMSEALLKSLWNAPSILRSGRLVPLDRAMSRDMTVKFHGQSIQVPVRAIDSHFGSDISNSFAFGTVREMFGNDVYLRAFQDTMRCPCVLDLGCNRGMFSLIAAKVLGARIIIAVDPWSKYETVHAFLSRQDGMPSARTYWRPVGSTRTEQTDSTYISIDTIIKENDLTVIDFAKIDIEGAETEVFSEPGWLAITQNIAMELHPEFTDVIPVLEAVERSGFQSKTTDQFGRPCDPKQAMFLYASRTGSLRP